MTGPEWRLAAALAAIAVALGAGAWRPLRTFRFTLYIAGGVAAALLHPALFVRWGPVNPLNPWMLLFLLQAVMFGMGVQMSVRDFTGIIQAPRGALVGLVCHYLVMSVAGFLLTRLFRFPPEIAAGVILVGSCSSGLSSNVMAYLARSNLALSVTITAATTATAPVMTPLLMKLFAGTLVKVDVVGLMLEIFRIVIVPIGAALLADGLRHAGPGARRRVAGTAAIGAAWLMFLAAGGWRLLSGALPSPAATGIGLAGYVAEMFVVGVAYWAVWSRWLRIERAMPPLSMAGIIYVTTVSAAVGRDNLLKVGILLAVCSILHNTAGYVFGYWLSRGAGLDRNSARSVAFEVGLANGGMAYGLAGSMGKLATMGLAPALFSAWMNVSGSLLANYWRRRPVNDAPPGPEPAGASSRA